MSQLFIVEGADGVGKTTFIERYLAHLHQTKTSPSKWANFVEAHPTDSADLEKSIELGVGTGHYENVQIDFLKSLYENLTKERVISSAYKGTVAVIRKASPENERFTQAMHAGELTHDQIAAEYLQVIFDHHRRAVLLAETFDVVLMDRHMPSFYALQMKLKGYEAQYIDRFMMLYNYLDAKNIPVIYLSASEEVIQKRLSQKAGISALDKDFGPHTRQVCDAYTQMFAEGLFPDVIHVDATSEKEEDYHHVFQLITNRLLYV